MKLEFLILTTVVEWNNVLRNTNPVVAILACVVGAAICGLALA